MNQKCPACGTTVDTTAAEPLARVACPQCGEKIRAERTFDHFDLLETVGIGGMGTVYKARDTLLDRLVALKLLRKDLGEDIDYATRLQQEARVAASVNHPSVIQVFSSGTDHDQFYLVMELVDHGSLDDLIEQKKRLPEELVLEAGIQVAKGLRAAYAKGLIHRDVKPANILFADDHTAKIGDFGLAGAAAEGAETRGEIWGTPYYVAPERLNNEPEDFRSDIYSLGATLFHAISGRAPIEGETNSAVTLRQLKCEPIDLKAVAPDVSEPTIRVLNQMIAPDPAKRFGSYDELVIELENAYGLLTGKKEFLANRRRKLPWIIGIAVLLIALIVIGSWAFISRKYAQAKMSELSARAEQMVAVAPLEAKLSEGRRQLAQNHYNVAGGIFSQVATDARNKQPLYDLARLHQALAAMIARENSQARQALQDVQNAKMTGFSNDDSELAKFLIETSKTLLVPGKISATDATKNTQPYAAFAALLFGLRDMEQADAADAAVWLEQAAHSSPTGRFAWIGELKPIAQKYLDDCKLYLEWKKEGDAATDPAAIARHLENTRAIVNQKKFKTRTGISEEVYAEEKSLSRQLADQQKAETAKREEQQKKAAEQTAQDAIRKKPQWLSEWKNRLISDLNRAPYDGAITDTTGVKYTGIARATADNLTMKIPYGESILPWSRISPAALLKISTSFINPRSGDAADRSWLCAIYANETGQAEEAKRLAGEAAKVKPEYGKMLPFVIGK
ncbi:MAG TPA: protein kinase [Chthoniobacterales bacterium]